MPYKRTLQLQDPAWLVYCVTHVASGREYFGQTNRTLNDRWIAHVCAARRRPNTRFLKAIAEFGADAFRGSVVLLGLTQEEASGYETALILSKAPDRLFNEYAGGGAMVREEDRVARGALISNSPAYLAHRERLKAQWADPAQRQAWLESRADKRMRSSQAHRDNWHAKSESEKTAQLARMRAGRVRKGQVSV